MTVTHDTIPVSTRGHTDMLDITEQVREKLARSGLRNGTVTDIVSGSTAGLSTIEYEPGLIKDFPSFFEKIAPQGDRYHHEETWHDGNGHSHVRASLLGPSLMIPFANGRLMLGTWQQILLVDFDNRPRQRDVVVQLTGT